MVYSSTLLKLIDKPLDWRNETACSSYQRDNIWHASCPWTTVTPIPHIQRLSRRRPPHGRWLGGYGLTRLESRYESINLWKATAFLLFQTLHKPVDSLFLAFGIRCIKKLIILRACYVYTSIYIYICIYTWYIPWTSKYIECVLGWSWCYCIWIV